MSISDLITTSMADPKSAFCAEFASESNGTIQQSRIRFINDIPGSVVENHDQQRPSKYKTRRLGWDICISEECIRLKTRVGTHWHHLAVCRTSQSHSAVQQCFWWVFGIPKIPIRELPFSTSSRFTIHTTQLSLIFWSSPDIENQTVGIDSRDSAASIHIQKDTKKFPDTCFISALIDFWVAENTLSWRV